MTGYKTPPSIEKSRQVAAAFSAKVSILEKWGRDGLPEDILRQIRPDGTFSGDILPRDHAKLRRWRGVDGSLVTWTDPLIDRPVTGKHPELAERYKVAITGIEKWLARKKGEVSALKTKVEVLQAENDRLRVQNTELLGHIQQLNGDLAIAKATLTGRR